MPAEKRKLSYAAEWFRIAEEDFGRVSRRLKEGDVEDAAFRLQQSLEKYFKGYLIVNGWKLKRIHDLEALLDDAVKFDRALERYRSLCQQVTSYYIIERYPTFEEGPSATDVRSAYKKAQQLVRHLKTLPSNQLLSLRGFLKGMKVGAFREKRERM